jgi:dihydrofolate synthase / folylpolyglutamate synthase
VTYAQAIQFLYDLRWFGTKLGLENTFRLAELAGNPQQKLRFIHVAGTNGKGSTCAMLESICRAAGLRVGLYTSPHLISFGERIQVNRRLLTQEETIELVRRMHGLVQHFPQQACPTFFEVVTIMALLHFAEQKCDLVIWETGMGGRLDASNVVTPLASVITNVDYDHQIWLGDTLEKIAFEKAGIIKQGVPVVTAASPDKGLPVIAAVARERQAPLTTVDWADVEGPPLNHLKMALAGEFQMLNAAVALKTLRVLSESLSITKEAIATGLSTVQWPGRMERLITASGQNILLDGAHNPAGVEVLCPEIERQFPRARPTIIFGVLRDKDWKTMVARLAPMAGRLVLTPVKSERSLPPQELLPVLQSWPARISTCSSLSEALKQTADEPNLVICGSLYLVGEAMELLQVSAVPARNERDLNEWGVAKPNKQGAK